MFPNTSWPLGVLFFVAPEPCVPTFAGYFARSDYTTMFMPAMGTFNNMIAVNGVVKKGYELLTTVVAIQHRLDFFIMC